MSLYEDIALWPDQPGVAVLKRRAGSVRDLRPAMLVVPGGGYGSVCESTEGYPVADRFEALGFRVFLLRYRVKPSRFPEPQRDLCRAVKVIRSRAAEWGVRKNELAVCGFSAGGHLCGCAGTIWNKIDADAGDRADGESARPDAMVLGYPVITSGNHAHKGSFVNLLGTDEGETCRFLSLEKRVTKATSPAFIFHTMNDQVVPVENSILLARAMHKAGVPCELRLFPDGPHGMCLGYGRSDIREWPEDAVRFLKLSCGFRFPEPPVRRRVILTFDDACRSHHQLAAPLLRKYGFGATFFITRFNDEWRKKNGKYLLGAKEIRELAEQGFDIGNHTWNHPCLQRLTDEEIRREVQSLSDFLRKAGCPEPVSFAYPGGPYAANAVPVLRELGFRCARTTEAHPWRMGQEDPMRLPSFSLQLNDELAFYSAVAASGYYAPSVLLFHGVPDPVHAHVNTDFAVFEKFMTYLYRENFEVLSLRDALERQMQE